MSSESPYAPPKSSLVNTAATGIYGFKQYVIHQDGVEWPSRCFKCNTDTNTTKKVKLVYVNPWIYLSLLITPILTIILALIFQKRFTVQLPICEAHLKKRRNFLFFQWGTVVLTIAGFTIGATTNSDIVIMLSIILVLVILISALIGRMIYVAKFKKYNLWIRGAGKEFVCSLPSFVN